MDFFRNFTVDVVGVGDVCSFAQMDVRRHGHPGWHTEDQARSGPETAVPLAKTNHYTQVSTTFSWHFSIFKKKKFYFLGLFLSIKKNLQEKY